MGASKTSAINPYPLSPEDFFRDLWDINAEEESMGEARQIVYRFDGNPANDEIVLDHYGEQEIPLQGHIINRKDKQWNVVQVSTERSLDPRGHIPIHRIFLTSDLNLYVQVHKP